MSPTVTTPTSNEQPSFLLDTPTVKRPSLSLRKLSNASSDTDTDSISDFDRSETPKRPLKLFRKNSNASNFKAEPKKDSIMDLFIFAGVFVMLRVSMVAKVIIFSIIGCVTGLIWSFYSSIINMYISFLQGIKDLIISTIRQVIQMTLKVFLPKSLRTLLPGNFALSEEEDIKEEPTVKLSKKELTLVLDLDETLIHCNRAKPTSGIFTKFLVPSSTGIHHEFYLKKRPHLEEFLEGVAKEFNVMIYTASRMDYANTAINMMINKKYISKRFYRESCYKTDEGWAKDLTRVGAELDKVILLDNCKVAGSYQPENHIHIKSWYNDENDTCLIECKNRLLKIAEQWKADNDVNKDLRQYIKASDKKEE